MIGVRVRLRFNVLGPIELLRDDVVQPLGATKQRTLLTALLLHANSVVSTDSLVEMLWEEAPPASAIQNLRTYAAGLRRILREDKRLIARGDGYVLRVEEGELDLDDFGRFADRGHQALIDDDATLAREHLTSALRQCRGRPAACTTPGAAMSALLSAIEERVLTVVEELLDARLALGEHREVIAELRRLVTDYPLRERFHGQLMLALSRSGRQTDALLVFQQVRSRLVTELGIEPGSGLQDVHQRILAGEDAAEPVPHRSSGYPRPAQLPPVAVDFTGRVPTRAQLAAALAPEDAGGPRVAVVCGVGGSGKTALAVRVAHDVREAFPDGQMFLELGGTSEHPLGAEEALGRLLRGLGVDGAAMPTCTPERTALYRSLLAERRVLIVLDDAHDAAQLRPLLPGTPGCSVLVTTRVAIAGLDGADQVPLSPLDGTEDEELFWRIVGTGRRLGHAGAARRVVQACGGLPLAIRIAASRLAVRRHWSVEDLAARLADSRRRLDELEVDDLSVRASFELSYRALSPEQASAFALISLCDVRELPIPAVAALIGSDEYAAGAIAERLVDLNLLVSLAPGRYRHHDLLRLFAREKLDATTTPAVRWAALEALCTAYAQWLRDATALTRPGYVAEDSTSRFTTPEAAWAWQETEVPIIVTLIEQCAADAVDAQILADLLHQAQGYLRSRGQWDDWERAAIAVMAASMRTHDPRAELTARSHLGQLASLHGRFGVSASHLQAALELTRQLGDRVQEAAVLNRIGMLEYACEEGASAMRRHDLAYDICKSIDDLHGMCANLTNIGKCLLSIDRPTAALEALTTALAHAQELADEDMAMMVIHHVARCQAALGQYDLAIAGQSKVVRATRARGMREGEAFSLAELGRALLAAGRPARAIASLDRAVDLFRELPSPVGVADILVSLIEALRREGQLTRAEQLSRELDDLHIRLDIAAVPEMRALLAAGATDR